MLNASIYAVQQKKNSLFARMSSKKKNSLFARIKLFNWGEGGAIIRQKVGDWL